MARPFEPGNQAAKGHGRPLGAKNKDKQNYLDLQVWAGLIMEGLIDATAKEKIEVGFRGLALLLPKIANLPSTPEESAVNALLKQQEIKLLESEEPVNETQP